MLPIELTKEEISELVAAYGVAMDEPFRFAINLVEDGSVVTRDGEYLGTWVMDENEHPSFIPDGADEPLFFSVYIGMLCERIREWHEGESAPTTGV